MSAGPPYTREEIERAIRLRDEQGLTWPETGAQIGRDYRSLKSTVTRFRKGTWQPAQRASRTARINALIERLVGRGYEIRRICRRLRMNYPAVWRRLHMLGLDEEMRREIAAENRSPA